MSLPPRTRDEEFAKLKQLITFLETELNTTKDRLRIRIDNEDRLRTSYESLKHECDLWRYTAQQLVNPTYLKELLAVLEKLPGTKVDPFTAKKKRK